MKRGLLTFLIALAANLSFAFRIKVGAGEKVAFYEKLKKGQRFGVNFQVEEGGNYDIDFMITDPKGQEVLYEKKSSYGTFSFTASLDGKYEYVFSNEMSQVTEKKLSFSILGIPDTALSPDGTKADPLEEELGDITNLLKSVQEEQQYIINRQKMHHDIAESTNSRALWWFIFQALFLVLICIWQVFYLTRFFEVKRVV